MRAKSAFFGMIDQWHWQDFAKDFPEVADK
jgi:hypothetical protein